jgi:transposase
MDQATQSTSSTVFVGLDLGVRKTFLCALDAAGKRLKQGSVPTTEEGLRTWVTAFPGARAVLETGAPSRWIEAFLRKCGWHAITTDAGHVAPELRNRGEKSDRHDAQRLAELLRVNSAQLAPVVHKPEAYYRDYTVLMARKTAVEMHSTLINQLRSIAKAVGQPLPKCDTASFMGRAAGALPPDLSAATDGLRHILKAVQEAIRKYDDEVETISERHVVTKRFRKIPGVGPLTALAFAVVVFRPERFKNSDALAAYLGLTPRRAQSGPLDPQGRISKQGNRLLRTYLVQAANYILTHGEDCDLKQWAEAYIARGGGKNARKRAVVAVARRLATKLFALWRSGQDYDPLHATRTAAAAAEERLRQAG